MGYLDNNGLAYFYQKIRQEFGDNQISFSVTIPASAWSDNQATVSNSNLLSSDKYVYYVMSVVSSDGEYSDSAIKGLDVTTDGSITFTCDSAPTSDVTVNILRVNNK